jgi:hypothetical protein
VPHATTGAPAWRRRALGTVAVTLVAALAVATDARGALYRSELALWADAAAKSSSNARPHLRQALLLERAGREAEARAALAVAAAIDPFDSGIAALSHRSRRRMEVP